VAAKAPLLLFLKCCRHLHHYYYYYYYYCYYYSSTGIIDGEVVPWDEETEMYMPFKDVRRVEVENRKPEFKMMMEEEEEEEEDNDGGKKKGEEKKRQKLVFQVREQEEM